MAARGRFEHATGRSARRAACQARVGLQPVRRRHRIRQRAARQLCQLARCIPGAPAAGPAAGRTELDPVRRAGLAHADGQCSRGGRADPRARCWSSRSPVTRCRQRLQRLRRAGRERVLRRRDRASVREREERVRTDAGHADPPVLDPPAAGPGWQPGPHAGRVLDTILDLDRQVVSATLQANEELPKGSSFGGLRGGYARLESSAPCSQPAFVPGVKLSGTFPIRNGQLQTTTIRVTGSAASQGEVRIGTSTIVSGTLGGRRFHVALAGRSRVGGARRARARRHVCPACAFHSRPWGERDRRELAEAHAQRARRRDIALPAPARGQPGRLVPWGGLAHARARATGLCWCRSAIRPVTGAT